MSEEPEPEPEPVHDFLMWEKFFAAHSEPDPDEKYKSLEDIVRSIIFDYSNANSVSQGTKLVDSLCFTNPGGNEAFPRVYDLARISGQFPSLTNIQKENLFEIFSNLNSIIGQKDLIPLTIIFFDNPVSAEPVDPEASLMCWYAKSYENGIFVPKSKEKAFKLYKEAAEKGHVEAQYFLGVCYEEGNGVVKNDEMALK